MKAGTSGTRRRWRRTPSAGSWGRGAREHNLPAVALQQQRGTADQRATWSRIISAMRSSASRVQSDQRYPALMRR